MKISMKYGNETIDLQTDEQIKILKPEKIDLESETEILKKAFQNPINKESFEEFASSSERLLIIVNDATRPTPTARVLDYLSPILLNHSDVAFIVACGSHRAPTEDEFEQIFGKCYKEFKDKIFVHDAENKDEIEFIGKTSSGNKIGFNKKVFDYKNVVAINSVEPHYFAGYTGGRKSFLPGVAAYETIEYNHTSALEKEACGLALKGNPVNEDMMESVELLKEKINIFSIQIVLTPSGETYNVTTGDLHDSFLKAVEYSKQVSCIKLKEKGNIVVTVAPPPLDINLYQSQKALENGKLALEENGIIILYSKCPKGIGPEKFMNLLSSEETPEKVLGKIKEGYKLGYHKAAKIAELSCQADIWAVTGIDEEQIKQAFMKPYNDLQKALDDAVIEIKNKGDMPKIVVLPSGSLTVPFISNC